MHEQEKLCQLALSLIKGIGFSLWKRLIEQVGAAQPLFQSSLPTLKANLKGVPYPIIEAIAEKKTLKDAEEILGSHYQSKIQVASFFEDTYPERLKHIGRPPAFLYYKGNINFEHPRIISIVGTRKATPYGKNVVENIIAGLAKYDALVVSGLAYGIDIHAHKLALTHGMSTVGVLASSLDIIYPAVHKKIALSMLDAGGLVSETPIGSLLESFHFPNRNRLIAGLADATIVVEADYKSGAIITANFANDYNRDVFAVPGNIYEPFSTGCNHLIKTHRAHLLTSVEDIAYMMNWDKISQKIQVDYLNKDESFDLSQEEQDILQALKIFQKEIHIDELSQQTQLSCDRLSPILLQLELKNIIQSLPGSKFKLFSF